MRTKWIALLLGCVCFAADQPADAPQGQEDQRSYVLGPGDEISVRVLDSTDIPDKPIRIDVDGQIALPLVGRLQASGKSVAVLETEISMRLRQYIVSPQVSVNVTDFGSQPVSVLGAVMAPGVYQLNGHKSLAQVLALAKGFTPEAGGRVKITSYSGGSNDAGAVEPIHLSVTEVSVEDLLSASSTAGALLIHPHDVVTVPKAPIVYVIGEVHKPGGHMLNNRDSVSVLEAVAMAEGTLPTASPQHAKLLRIDPNTGKRVETALDLKRVLSGGADNVILHPNDILLVPTNVPRAVGLRSLEAVIQAGTGVVIWRHP